METYKQTSTEPLPPGDVNVKMVFEADEAKPGTGGEVTLWAKGKQIGAGRIDHTVPLGFTSYAGMDVGRDNGLVVDLAYEDKAPYAFTGTVKRVVFDLKPASMKEEVALHEHAGHQVSAGIREERLSFEQMRLGVGHQIQFRNNALSREVRPPNRPACRLPGPQHERLPAAGLETDLHAVGACDPSECLAGVRRVSLANDDARDDAVLTGDE